MATAGAQVRGKWIKYVREFETEMTGEDRGSRRGMKEWAWHESGMILSQLLNFI